MSNKTRFHNCFDVLDNDSQSTSQNIKKIEHKQVQSDNHSRVQSNNHSRVQSNSQSRVQPNSQSRIQPNNPNRKMNKEEFLKFRMNQNNPILLQSSNQVEKKKISNICTHTQYKHQSKQELEPEQKPIYQIVKKPTKIISIKIYYGVENKFIQTKVKSSTKIGKIIRKFNKKYPHLGERGLASCCNQQLPYYTSIEEHQIVNGQIIELLAGMELQPICVN